MDRGSSNPSAPSPSAAFPAPPGLPLLRAAPASPVSVEGFSHLTPPCLPGADL